MQRLKAAVNSPTVSVVISTLNRARLLEKTLTSLEFQNYDTFEVVVVNGPSSDNTADVCKKYGGHLVYGTIDAANLSKSRNAGINLSSGELVLFLDDDAFAEPDWIANIVAGYDSSKNGGAKIGGVGTRVHDHTGFRWQTNPFLIDRFYSPNFHRSPPLWAFEYADSQTIPHILGASSSFSRDALMAIGGFDGEIEYFLDESEVCRRIVEQGYTIRCIDSGASVHHQFAAGVTRDDRRLMTHPYPVVKNKYYVCLSDCRRHQGNYAEYLAACDAWRTELVDDARSHLADGNISRKELNAFLSEVERGARDGRLRAAQQQRQSITITPARSDMLVRFATRTPAGGRKTFCFISRTIPRHGPNGIARYIWDLATGFARIGHETHLITMTDGPSQVEYTEGLWIRHISRDALVPAAALHDPDSGSMSQRSDAARLNTAWAKAAHGEVLRLRQDRYIDQVIAPVWDQEGLYCALDRRLHTVISMNTTFHRYAQIEDNHIAHNTLAELSALERTYIRSARYFLSNSSSSTAHLRQDFAIDDAAIIAQAPHGVADVDPVVKQRLIHKQPRPDGPVRVLYVSRLERRKGTDLFLTVAVETMKNHPDVIFDMAGRDSYQGDPARGYDRFFAGLAPELHHRIIRHGEVSDERLQQLYAQADIFFVPSRYESFGIIFVEAMRCGLPVLTLDSGGARDIVDHGVTGLLAAGEDTAQLADFLSQLITDPDRRARMGAAGRERYMRQFEYQTVINTTLEALKFDHVAH